MAASVFDSPLHAQLFPTGETGRLFSDSAAIRAMLLIEGALAKAQGRIGMIPEVSAAAIHRASLEVQIDPGALAVSTGENGVCVPGLVAAFRAGMNAPEHAQYIHWGATSQDIIDSGLMLRLRQSLVLAETDLRNLLERLAIMAESYAETPMAARTYGQIATPTTFGAVLAQWGQPLADALEALPEVRARNLWVSLSGASGTSAVFGDKALALRAGLAEGLGLGDPERSWHTDRGPIRRIAGWMGGVTTALGAMGSTLLALSANGVDEVQINGAGASSTMPQKQNPIGPSVLDALGRQIPALEAALSASAAHQHQRDGAVWFAEWMCLPQIVLSCAAALQVGQTVASQLQPVPDQMRAVLQDGLGLLHAEALTFALAQNMSRPAAQAAVKTLCAEAIRDGVPLPLLARKNHPDLGPGLFTPELQTGQAAAEARAFAARVRIL
jgi:3-carboxy-cis,cis-muconate cycloisomerase